MNMTLAWIEMSCIKDKVRDKCIKSNQIKIIIFMFNWIDLSESELDKINKVQDQDHINIYVHI